MGLMGFEFIEFASPTPGTLEPIFEIMGFTKVATHRSKNVHLYRQGEINLILNNEPNSIASYFAAEHGHLGVRPDLLLHSERCVCHQLLVAVDHQEPGVQR
jgi:4-hydroxyphenylpyruvate dioxygenase-like putative hemolysin